MKQFMRAIEVMCAIKEKHGKPEKDIAEEMECPECGGRLGYTVSSYNGHTHGQCRTENCLRWME